MTEDISSIIDYYVVQKQKGLDFSEIRKELKAKNLEADKIKLIIREVDNRILFKAQNESFKVNSNGTKIIGLVLMFGGIFITVVTFFGIVDLGGSYLIAYGPIISGFLLYLQADGLAKGNGRIKNRKKKLKTMRESSIE
tara:strand:+ start:17461 stop:17877 length:417 start_codon:yes stop_codon:yes gene_type:complete